MALIDKNIIITPNIGAASDPKIVFSGADAATAAQNITLTAYPTNGGTLSFDGSTGQLFSVTNSMSGTIFSANDVSGIPSIEVIDTGLVKIAQYSGNVLLGTGTDTGLAKLQVTGSLSITGNMLYPANSKSAYGPNTTWSSYLHVGGDGVNGITRTASIASVVTTNGNLHLDSGSDKAMYLNHYSGTAGVNFGNGAQSITATLTAAGVFNGTNVTVNSNQTLHAGNYTSYSPTLTGGSASGTWGISITGNSATVSNIIANTGLLVNNLVAPALIDGLTTGNFRSTMFGTASNGNALSTSRWNSTPAPFSGLSSYGTAISWAGSDTHGFLALNYSTAGAIIGGGSGQAIQWSATLLHSSNYNSYSPTLTGGSASGTWGINVTGTSNNITAYTINQSVGTGNGPTFADVYSNGWLRNNNTNTGVYNQATVNHWYSENSASWTVGSTSTVYGEIRLRQGHQGTYKGSYYWDSAGVGLLNDQGGWSVRSNQGSGYGGQLYGAWVMAGNTILSAGNYNSYAPTLTGGSASGTWGINVTGSSATLTNFTAATSTNPSNVDSPTTLDVVGYCSQAGLPFSQSDGGLYSAGYSTSWYHQIYGDFRSGQIAVRGKNSGTWQSWRTVLDSSNYTSYSPTLTGGSASGTWGINVTGSAGSATYAYNCNSWFNFNSNYGHAVEGIYNAALFQGMFDMGPAYRLTAGGGVGNLYGTCWSHPNAGGAAANLDSHGQIVLINGGFASCMSYSIKASANVTAYSDERLKTNWKPLADNFVEKLANIKVGTYDRIDQSITQVGVSAQSLETLLPEAVITGNDEMQTKSVAYGNAALAAAVMLAKEFVEMKRVIEELKSEITKLKEDRNGTN